MPTEGEPLGFAEFLRILWVRRRTLLVVTGVVLGSALAYSFRQTPIYESEAEVLVRPVNFDPTRPTSSETFVNMETEQRVATSAAVAELAAGRLAGRGTAMSSISVEASEADTLVFSSSAPVPASATATARAFAEGYLEFRQKEVAADLRVARGPVEDEIKALSKRIETVQKALFNTPNDPSNEAERQGLQLEFTTLLTQRAALQARLNDLIAPEDVCVGEITQPAFPPTEPSSPNHGRTGALGLFAGLSLGVGVAFIRDRMDRRVRDRGELEAVAGLPVLTVVPRAPGRRNPNLPIGFDPGSPVSEAYRALATSLAVIASRESWKSVMVTSAGEKEGKTSTVANLGSALALAGYSVILVSADLRRPRLHELLSVTNDLGVSDLIVGEEENILDAARAVEGMSNLWVLPSGSAHETSPGGGVVSESDSASDGRRMGPTPGQLLDSDAIQKRLNELRQVYDFVIVDSPPVLGIADALSLAPIVEATILVADASRVTRDVLDEALHRLHGVDARVVGTVLTKFDPSKSRAYSAYYGSYAPPPAVHPNERPVQDSERSVPVESGLAEVDHPHEDDDSPEPPPPSGPRHEA